MLHLALSLGAAAGLWVAGNGLVVTGPTLAAANRQSVDAEPAAAAQAVRGGWEAEMAEALVALTNDERVSAGLPPLIVDAGLTEVGRQRAADIVADYSHAGLAARCGWCGENINQTAGTDPVQRLFAGWMNSPSHRANILRPETTRIGIGVYGVAGRYYAVQVFAE